jgi:hypothetical protein
MGPVVAVAAALAALVGCSAQTDEEDVQGKEGKLATAESELKLSGAKYVGRIASGDTRTVSYDYPPAFRAFGFDAKAGDAITVTVSSLNGDAMAWITDSNYNVLAANDDASAQTLDSKVTYTIPKSSTKRTFRLVFRDYDLMAATFRVSLDVKSDSSSSTCSYEGQSYAHGASFPAADGCNTCSCSASGVACTKMACLQCNPPAEPNRNYLGTPQSCMQIRFTCQAGWRPFQNSCGCGCERVN